MKERKVMVMTGYKDGVPCYINATWVDTVVTDSNPWAIVIDSDGDVHRTSIYDIKVVDPD